MKTWAIIPARAGSKRVPGKNTRIVGGRPLVCWTLDAAIDSGVFERVLVSSDSDEVRQFAISAGADPLEPRPSALAADLSTSHEVVRHVLSDQLRQGVDAPDAICLLQPTSPLRNAEHILAAVSAIDAAPAVDCLVSCLKVPDLLLPNYQCTTDEEGLLVAADGNAVRYPSSGDNVRHLSRTGAIYITRYPQIESYLVGGRILPFIMDGLASIDINVEADLVVADALLRLNERGL